MKIKSDFVTNSSSTSFCIEKSRLKKLTDPQKVKMVEMKLTNWEGLDVDYHDPDVISFFCGDKNDEDIDYKCERVAKILGVLIDLGEFGE